VHQNPVTARQRSDNFFRDLWKIILGQKSDVKPTDNRRVCKELPIACADGTRSDPSSTRVRAAVQTTMHEVRGQARHLQRNNWYQYMFQRVVSLCLCKVPLVCIRTAFHIRVIDIHWQILHLDTVAGVCFHEAVQASEQGVRVSTTLANMWLESTCWYDGNYIY
jgi:hypothetical protein